jgi:hypothetical protein
LEREVKRQTVITLGMDQITKFIFHLDGPLVTVTYSNPTQIDYTEENGVKF